MDINWSDFLKVLIFSWNNSGKNEFNLGLDYWFPNFVHTDGNVGCVGSLKSVGYAYCVRVGWILQSSINVKLQNVECSQQWIIGTICLPITRPKTLSLKFWTFSSQTCEPHDPKKQLSGQPSGDKFITLCY